MSMPRIHWEDLPATTRAAVEREVSAVLKAESASAGVNSGIAARVHTNEVTYFAKGMPTDHPQVRTQQREAAINPYLPATSPRVLWQVRAGGWHLLGYEHLDARHAVYAPGSTDLEHVVAALAQLQHTTCPHEGVKDAPQRWAGYAGGADTTALAGETLLHTDLAPHNVLITDRAHLIDWAWPTRGAAWIDPAVWVLRLMEAGHSAEDADRWARRLPSWASAPRDGVALFSAANARAWEEIARTDPQEWKQGMARLAHSWATYWRRAA